MGATPLRCFGSVVHVRAKLTLHFILALKLQMNCRRNEVNVMWSNEPSKMSCAVVCG